MPVPLGQHILPRRAYQAPVCADRARRSAMRAAKSMPSNSWCAALRRGVLHFERNSARPRFRHQVPAKERE